MTHCCYFVVRFYSTSNPRKPAGRERGILLASCLLPRTAVRLGTSAKLVQQLNVTAVSALVRRESREAKLRSGTHRAPL